MNRLIVFICFFLLAFIVHAQCPPDYTVLRRQGQIDSFSILYPGCTKISNELTLSTSGIKNLAGLSGVERISGRLRLVGTDLLSLEGLAHMEQITQLELHSNAHLQSLEGIEVDSMDFLSVGGSSVAFLADLASVAYIRIIYISYSTVPTLNLPASLDYNIMEVSGQVMLTNLESFPDPSAIHSRKVEIIECPALTSLDGIESSGITELTLRDNSALADISALEQTTVLQTLSISGSNALQDVTAIGKINVLRFFAIGSCNAFTTISFQDLTQIETISLGSNENLVSVVGPGSITKMNTLSLYGNPTLTNISGFQNIHTIHNIGISNTSLTNLDFLPSVDSILGDLFIYLNPQLEQIAGLDGLQFVKQNLFINSNHALTSIAGLGSLNTVEGDLNLSNNSKLSSLQSLHLLQTIGGSLILESSGQYEDLQGLSALQSIGGNLKITQNPIQRLTGLEALDSIAGGITISNNYNLITIDALAGLRHLGGSFSLNGNNNITAVPAFDHLLDIGGDLQITGNPRLQSLEGFYTLLKISSQLTINGNDSLQSLAGLDNIQWYYIYGIVIVNNPLLSFCTTHTICRNIAEDRPATIANNAPGCQSTAEVLSLCGPLDTYDSKGKQIQVFPNPTADILYLNTTNAIEAILVLDALGMPVIRHTHPGNEVDLSALPAGVYFLQITTGDVVILKKIVVE